MTTVRRCAARELLLGWLNVTNKTAVRAEKVKQNATKLRDRANEVEVKARASLRGAKNVLERLRTTMYENISVVNRSVNMLESAIANLNTFQRKAEKAVKNAEDSIEKAANAYGVILITARVVNRNLKEWETISYATAEKQIRDIVVDAGMCPEQLFLAANLTRQTAALEVSPELNEWKNATISLLRKAQDDLQSDEQRCHSTFAEHNKKFPELKAAIEGTVEPLGVALKDLNEAYTVVQQADSTVKSATNAVATMNETMLSSFNRSGALLCDMLRRREELDTQLHATMAHLAEAHRHAVTMDEDRVALLATSAAVDKVLLSVKAAISKLPNSGPLSLPLAGGLFAPESIYSAKESAERLKNAASLSLEHASQVKQRTKDVEAQLSRIRELFADVTDRLIAGLNETQLNVSNLTADNCNKELSEALRKPWERVFDHAVKMNTRVLWEAKRGLEQLEAQNKLMGSNLTQISSTVHTMEEVMDAAAKFEAVATTAAASAVADVLRSLMKEVCASAAELHELRMDNNGFKSTVEVLRNNVSVESRRAEAAWKRDSAMSEIPHDVGDGFTYASRSVAMLEKQLQRVDAQYAKVASELEKELTKPDGGDAKSYFVVVNFVRDINSNLTALSLPSVCNSDRIDEVVTLLVNDKGAMLKNVSAIVSLGELIAKVEKRVTAVRDQMRKVASSAADVQAAVEEAIRRARDANAGRRCTPLHEQLANMLQRLW
ncbi:hypothetical protein ERJ75_000083300 [Trypanosoma vivax]|nr:hypothetical protein ERJ75_000083300 [Trypanosoma vivax]